MEMRKLTPSEANWITLLLSHGHVFVVPTHVASLSLVAGGLARWETIPNYRGECAISLTMQGKYIAENISHYVEGLVH